jgi:hypothetical protein
MGHVYSVLVFAAAALLPVLAKQSCLAPFWINHTYAEPGGSWLPLGALFTTAILIPGWFAFLGWRLVRFHGCKLILLGLSWLVIILVLNAAVDYCLWGLATGRLTTPDQLTVVVLLSAGGIGLCVFGGPVLLGLAIRALRPRDAKEDERIGGGTVRKGKQRGHPEYGS